MKVLIDYVRPNMVTDRNLLNAAGILVLSFAIFYNEVSDTVLRTKKTDEPGTARF